MSKREYGLFVVILLLVTNVTTASVVYSLLYSVPAAAQATPSPTVDEPVLPKPDLKIPTRPEPSVVAPRDPIKVLDPDAAYTGQQYEVQKLKVSWVLTEIVTLQDGFGGTELRARFEGDSRIYREGDRLPGTHFTLKSICDGKDGAFIEVEGDLGIRVKLHLIR